MTSVAPPLPPTPAEPPQSPPARAGSFARKAAKYILRRVKRLVVPPSRIPAGNPLFDRRVTAQPEIVGELVARFGLLDPAVDLDGATDALIGEFRRDAAALGQAVEPDVSIIVPVHGKIRHTLACVLAVLRSGSRRRFEIIVVDDASSDRTAEALAGLEPGLRVVRNDVNQGFVRSCNRGAAAARGAVLVFLNNDTVVLPGWLDELVATLADAPDAGLAGSRLLYPDGTLQEAGGLLWRDGSAMNVGRHKHPAAPEYSYRRVVDYCSGASIAIPRALWERLGGFDLAFVPAYGEDSDLALRVRQAGLKVYYQPLSTVVHFEGISCGRDVTQSIKKHQVDNARTLAERWRDDLSGHGRPGQPVVAEMDRTARRRVLVIDHRQPQPDHDAGSVTCVGLIDALIDNGYSVTFLPENVHHLQGYTQDLQRRGVQCIYAPFYRSVADYLKHHGDRFDVILAFRVVVLAAALPAIRRHCPQAKLIFHTSDLHFLREERDADLRGSGHEVAQARRARELELICAADCAIVHSTHEEEVVKALRPQARLYCFPLIQNVHGSARPFGERRDYAFIGGYEHTPNVDAVVYFITEVLPLVAERLPDAVFKVVGSKLPDHLRAMAAPNVEMVGFVEDLGSVLDHVRLTIAPLRYGAGIKGKVGSSLSYGVPCVATPIAAEGMGLETGTDIMVADGPQAFADALVQAYTDEALWGRLSCNGMAYLERTSSSTLATRRVGEILDMIGAPTVTPPASG